jgi:N-acetylmuramoyl-L-alanine amidase
MSNGRRELERSSDAELLARCIWGEARSESIEGKLAVAHVVLNRVKAQSYYGRTVKEVMLKPWQFSCFNENDPNLAKILGLKTDNPGLAYCQAVADMALLSHSQDPTGGATHYHTTSIKPSWANSSQMTFLCRIGNHLFYRESLNRNAGELTSQTDHSDRETEGCARKDDQE